MCSYDNNINLNSFARKTVPFGGVFHSLVNYVSLYKNNIMFTAWLMTPFITAAPTATASAS